MEKNPLFDNVPDEELGALLHQLLIVDGHDDVEIHHPTEGLQVVTKDNYKKIIASIMEVKKMSPAKRLLEEKRVRNAYQTKHRTQMLSAKFQTVDIEDEENFGTDINGNKIDMEGMSFVQTTSYLKEIKPVENEIGAFVHPENKKEPIRIINQQKEK